MNRDDIIRTVEATEGKKIPVPPENVGGAILKIHYFPRKLTNEEVAAHYEAMAKRHSNDPR